MESYSEFSKNISKKPNSNSFESSFDLNLVKSEPVEQLNSNNLNSSISHNIKQEKIDYDDVKDEKIDYDDVKEEKIDFDDFNNDSVILMRSYKFEETVRIRYEEDESLEESLPATRKRANLTRQCQAAKRQCTVAIKTSNFKCDECPALLGSMNSLRNHKYHHRNLKAGIKFSCGLCDKSFTRKETVKRHERIHLKNKKKSRKLSRN